MPAVKMKVRSVTSCVKQGSSLHVRRKPSKRSRNTTAVVQLFCKAAELDNAVQQCKTGHVRVEASTQEICIDEAAGSDKLLDRETPVSQSLLKSENNSVSDIKLEFSSFKSQPSMETIFSPKIKSDLVPCEASVHDSTGEYGYGVRQQEEAESDDWRCKSCDYQNCIADCYISDLTDTDLNIDALDGRTVYFPDYQYAETNMMIDRAEGCMMLPSLEEMLRTVETEYAQSCEELLMMSDDSWFQLVSQQIKPCNQEINHGLPDWDAADSFDPYSFLRNFPDFSNVEPDLLPALLPKETSKRKSITLVLDLDETLVHSTVEPCNNADFTFSVFFNMKDHTVYVRQRPFLRTFLQRVTEMFEVVVFTASQSIYAEKLLNILDPERKLFSRRMYRESCVFSGDGCTKDLTVLGIDLAKVAIIDNSPQVFKLQVNNGIPIKSWFDDPSDRALISLLPFLETLVDVDDVRHIISKKFGAKV